MDIEYDRYCLVISRRKESFTSHQKEILSRFGRFYDRIEVDDQLSLDDLDRLTSIAVNYHDIILTATIPVRVAVRITEIATRRQDSSSEKNYPLVWVLPSSSDEKGEIF